MIKKRKMRRKAGREVGRQKCNEQIWAQNVEECYNNPRTVIATVWRGEL